MTGHKGIMTHLRQRSTKTLLRIGGALIGATILATGVAGYLQASDHDDGEVDLKGRSLNLTDLYVFREKDQNPSAKQDDLVLIMNTNPRSVARQQYYFSTNARYEFHISQVNNKNSPVTGKADTTLRFEFEAPDANQEQRVKVTTIRDGRSHTGYAKTTSLTDTSPNNVSKISVDGKRMTVFAGLREDPFFFDVEQFFRVRAGALGTGPAVGFRTPETAVDFARGYNVNAIAVRVPIALLQGNSSATTFDVWETISVKEADGQYRQVERLARPAINEGLLTTNDLLNTLNAIGPDFEAAALAGQKAEANAAQPILAEASRTLQALGNNRARTTALLQAFLPDVMRIDTTQPSGYGNELNARSSPVRGRMLEDDVVDITLSVLTNGAVTTDNVSYDGTPGNPSQGHQPLDSRFPYLALPN